MIDANREKKAACFIFIVLLFLQVYGYSLPGIPGKPEKALKKIYESAKITFTSELEITRDSFPINVPFKNITSATPGEKNIYILDASACNIKILSDSGQFINSFGQKGAEPGNLLLPYHMIIAEGKLIIWENHNQRFSIFTSDGKFIKLVKPKHEGFVWNMKTLENGCLILERELSQVINKEFVQFCILELYSKELESIRILYKKQVFRQKYYPEPDQRHLPMPFNFDVTWDILPGNRIVIGYSDRYSIEILDAVTGKIQTFSHSYTPLKITEADMKSFFDNCGSVGADGKLVIGADKFTREHTIFPDYKPAFNKIITDSEGNILVFTYKDSSSASKVKYFDAFDSMGNFINQVKIIPEEGISVVKIFAGKGDVFWARVAVKDFEAGIVKYRIR